MDNLKNIYQAAAIPNVLYTHEFITTFEAGIIIIIQINTNKFLGRVKFPQPKNS